MANRIPIDTLYHVTVVTRDARETARQHSRFYGIPSWKVVDHASARLTRTSFHGRGRGSSDLNAGMVGKAAAPGEFGFLSARGSTPNGGITFEIIQPTLGLSTFEHFLVTRGSGVHGVCMTVVKRAEIVALRNFLEGEGVPLALSYALNDSVDFLYFDTRKALGGFYVQVIVSDQPDWAATIAATETWSFEDQIPTDAAARPTQGSTAITHFGVIVHDLESQLKNFAKLFGQSVWRGMNWRTARGSLEETTCNGKPVIHSYFTGRADVGKTPLGPAFGFEVVQPCFGPSHYKEDFLQLLGPGIHHIDLNFPVTEWSEWDALNNWLDSDFGAPCCMSGWLRSKSALFHYHDTRKKLGYVVEIHAPRPDEAPKARWAPDYWYDFSVASSV